MYKLISIKLNHNLSFLAILLQETKDAISILTKKNSFSTILKKDIVKSKEIRTLDSKEIESINEMIGLNEELKDLNSNIVQINKCIDNITKEKHIISKKINDNIFDKKVPDKSFVSYKDIEDSLSTQGFKNFIYLEKNNLIKTDEKDNALVIIVDFRGYKFNKNDEKILLAVLNQTNTDKLQIELKNTIQSLLYSKRKQSYETHKSNSTQSSTNKEKRIKLSTIKTLLNENGFNNLKFLCDNNFINIDSEEYINFNIPFISKEVLKKTFNTPETIAEALNQNNANVFFNMSPYGNLVKDMFNQFSNIDFEKISSNCNEFLNDFLNKK